MEHVFTNRLARTGCTDITFLPGLNRNYTAFGTNPVDGIILFLLRYNYGSKHTAIRVHGRRIRLARDLAADVR